MHLEFFAAPAPASSNTSIHPSTDSTQPVSDHVSQISTVPCPVFKTHRLFSTSQKVQFKSHFSTYSVHYPVPPTTLYQILKATQNCLHTPKRTISILQTSPKCTAVYKKNLTPLKKHKCKPSICISKKNRIKSSTKLTKFT